MLIGLIAIALAIYFGLWQFHKGVSEKLSTIQERIIALQERIIALDELRANLYKDQELGVLSSRLSNLFSQANVEQLLNALEKGDMMHVSQILNVPLDELNGIFLSFRTHAVQLQSRYPDLADFAKGMRLTGSL